MDIETFFQNQNNHAYLSSTFDNSDKVVNRIIDFLKIQN